MSLLKKKSANEKNASATAAAKKSGSSKNTLADGRLYDVILRPIVTEKTTMAAEQNKVVFKIAPHANKADVKAAVEAIFKVTVLKVNTINVEGKMKKFRGRDGQRGDTRKAIVTLAAGQSIDFAAGSR